ncbi:glycosyltransferase family 2 protein [candidate division KSB1 bacterium]|nr:glycosyltransferase family 2 protein [candidate division KSB1 bacterium]RQW07181.1 MAG: glycosyltransferase family 2 protein [candidate division KSB1 bacterium]
MSALFSIIIVNWNAVDLLIRCVSSIYDKNNSTDFEIIVVDNFSEDESIHALAKKFPDVKIVVNSSNIGYAAACNRGARIAAGEFLLFMNNDTMMMSDSPLMQMKQIFETHKRVGVVGGALILPNGHVQTVGRYFLNLRRLVLQQLFFIKSTTINNAGRTGIVAVDYVDGAFLCCRRCVLQDIGFWDEHYFMFAEDMDLCWRALAANWRTVVSPEIRIQHEHGASVKKVLPRMIVQSIYSNSRFIEEAYGPVHRFFARILYLVGLCLRIPLAITRPDKKAGDYFHAIFQLLGFEQHVHKAKNLSNR